MMLNAIFVTFKQFSNFQMFFMVILSY